MATATKYQTAFITTTDMTSKTTLKAVEPVKIDITRLPTEDDDLEGIKSTLFDSSWTILHIYFEHPCQHKRITPVLSPSQERRFGPTPKQQKERRITKKAERKLREATQTPSPLTPSFTAALPSPDQASSVDQKVEEGSYFLHTPYLSFHLPPSILYTSPTTSSSSSSTSSRYPPSRPVALVHTGCLWRRYKIQLGPSLSLPGVVDPRGVVSWRHNGGSKKELEKDGEGGRVLKGYKVRGWRLWGETGKRYVHWIRDARKAGVSFDDPDVEPSGAGDERGGERHGKVGADEVVYLTWTRPLSKQTRLYTFTFRGIEFQWKGTETVSEGRKCGWMLRFCHLKLVAKVPVDSTEEKEGTKEICLGKYTSSIAAEKSGTLEVFDEAVLRFVEGWMPGLLGEKEYGREKGGDDIEDKDRKIARLKKGILYQLIVATVLCMANAEKEKRHTLIDLIIGIAENGGNGGG